MLRFILAFCWAVVLPSLLIEQGAQQEKDRQAEEHFKRGNAHGERNDFDGAIAEFSKAIQLRPKYALAYYQRGHAHVLKGQNGQAIADFTEVLRIEPNKAGAYLARGRAYCEKKEYGAGIKDITEAVRLNPNDTWAYEARGWAHRNVGEYAKAMADYDRAIQLDPENASALYNRGGLYGLKGEFAKAVADLKEAIRLAPRLAGPYKDLAWIWAACPDGKHRDGKRAIEYALKACELSAWKDVKCYGTLAAAYAEQGQFEEAIKVATRGLTIASEEEKSLLRSNIGLYRSGRPLRMPRP